MFRFKHEQRGYNFMSEKTDLLRGFLGGWHSRFNHARTSYLTEGAFMTPSLLSSRGTWSAQPLVWFP